MKLILCDIDLFVKDRTHDNIYFKKIRDILSIKYKNKFILFYDSCFINIY